MTYRTLLLRVITLEYYYDLTAEQTAEAYNTLNILNKRSK